MLLNRLQMKRNCLPLVAYFVGNVKISGSSKVFVTYGDL